MTACSCFLDQLGGAAGYACPPRQVSVTVMKCSLMHGLGAWYFRAIVASVEPGRRGAHS